MAMDDPSVRRRHVNRDKDDLAAGNGRSERKNRSNQVPRRNAPIANQHLPAKQWIAMLTSFYFVVTMLVWYSNSNLPPPKLVQNSKPDEFTEELARKHLMKFVSFGHRVAGSTANEVHSVRYILREVLEIKNNARSSVNFEVDVQHPTGSFGCDFLGGFASYYTNITNTVVKISPPGAGDGLALLLNCHTDSVIGSPGASDDAVACAVLLEVMRAFVADSDTPLLHPVIFLFNGAEENILQASHGFITKHKWAKQVKAFINLEAAGSGGKEIVFQTGPQHPWLLTAWINHAPYPYGTVFGQELFQSGVIPSDTDFRIFRDYGKVPGLDLAYIKNGYVYHTQYDNPAMVKPGCVQRAGDNILAVVNHLVKSSASLLTKSEQYRHGSAAFFDFLGISMFLIPMRLLSILNLACCGASFVYIFRRFVSFPNERDVAGLYGRYLIKATAAIILSLVGGLLAALGTAGVVMYFGRFMSFYAQPLLAVFLYVSSAVAGMYFVHSCANKYLFKLKNLWMTEGIFFDSALLLCAIILFQLNRLEIQSSFLLLFTMAPLVVGRCYLLGKMFAPDSNTPPGVRMLIHLLLLSFPMIIFITHFFVVLELFIPLCGRSGSLVPPDVIIAFLIAVLSFVGGIFTTSFLHSVKSPKWLLMFLVACTVCSVMFSVSSHGFPYDSSNPAQPKPKRLFLQHTSREFYSTGGSLVRSDSGLWVNALDYSGLNIDLGSEALSKTPTVECEGLFCHWPFTMPLPHLIKNPKYLQADPPNREITDKEPLVFKPVQRKRTLVFENSTTQVYKERLEFWIEGPDHMSLCLAPLSSARKSVQLTKWSIEDEVDKGRARPTTDKTGVEGRFYTDWFFIYYGSGRNQASPWQPWVELLIFDDLTMPEDDGPLLEAAVSAHYYRETTEVPVPPLTKELEKVVNELHDWTTPNTWVSLYKNYLI